MLSSSSTNSLQTPTTHKSSSASQMYKTDCRHPQKLCIGKPIDRLSQERHSYHKPKNSKRKPLELDRCTKVIRWLCQKLWSICTALWMTTVILAWFWTGRAIRLRWHVRSTCRGSGELIKELKVCEFDDLIICAFLCSFENRFLDIGVCLPESFNDIEVQTGVVCQYVDQFELVDSFDYARGACEFFDDIFCLMVSVSTVCYTSMPLKSSWTFPWVVRVFMWGFVP